MRTFLFCTAVIALLLFNAYTSIARHAIAKSVSDLQAEVDTCLAQTKELSSLVKRYANETLPGLATIEKQLQEMHRNRKDSTGYFPIRDDEFVVTKKPFEIGKKTFFFAVPKNGKHRLKIRIRDKQNSFFERNFDLESGQAYKVVFVVQDKLARIDFPGEEPVEIELEDPVLAHSITERIGPVFATPNRAQWILAPDRVHVEKNGAIASLQYRTKKEGFDSKSFWVEFIAQSDGPITAAADDPEAVRTLLSILDGGSLKDTISYRFEDGHYVFE